MKKTLYIHIGRPKVGSSAIQHFLWDNRSVLAKNGYLYPESGQFHKAHHGLALVFLPNLPDAQWVKGISAKQMYSDFIAEVNRSNLNKAIVSSEIFYLLSQPAEIPAALLKDFEIKIICYVRRQDEVLLSSYVQEIKGNQIALNFDFNEYLQNEDRIALLDYKNILDKWSAVFGQENIIVRVYEHIKEQGSIFNDFLTAAGTSINDQYQLPPARLNPSPARDILELIHNINQFPAPEIVLRQLRAPLVRMSEQIGHEGKFSTNSILSQSVKQQIMDQFAESNRLVAKTYLDTENDCLFDEDASDITPENNNEDYQGIELERLVQMVAGLFVSQQKEITNLRTRILAQQKNIDSLSSGWMQRLKRKFYHS